MPYRTSEIHIVYPWINIETKRIETTQKPHPNKTKRNNFESIFWYCYAKPRCTWARALKNLLHVIVLFCFMCITNGKKIYIVFEVELCVCVSHWQYYSNWKSVSRLLISCLQHVFPEHSKSSRNARYMLTWIRLWMWNIQANMMMMNNQHCSSTYYRLPLFCSKPRQFQPQKKSTQDSQ